MPEPILEPVRIQRAAEPGEAVTQDFVVNVVPDGTLVASVSGGGSLIRLRHLVAYTAERRQFTEEEIKELPLFPPSIRANAHQHGYVVHNEFGRVGLGQPLTVSRGLLVKGEIEFVPATTDSPGAVSATLVLEGTNWPSVEIPLLLVIGKLQIDFPTPFSAHQGQTVRLPVTMTLPTGSPAAAIMIGMDALHWEIPSQVVSVPMGSSASTTLRLKAAPDAPLGLVSTTLRVKGFDGPYESPIPFEFTVEPYSKRVEAAEHIEAKANILGEGPPGPRVPVSDTEDAGNGGFVQQYSTGNIYWHPQTGAKWVHGAILAKYLGLGGPSAFLGYPLTDENGTPDGTGRYNDFQGGSIYYSVTSGAHEIHGPIRDHWVSLGREQSYLGYPIWDQKGNMSRFQRGTIQLTDGQPCDVADARVVHTGVIHVDGAAANGWAELTISSTGR